MRLPALEEEMRLGGNRGRDQTESQSECPGHGAGRNRHDDGPEEAIHPPVLSRPNQGFAWGVMTILA